MASTGFGQPVYEDPEAAAGAGPGAGAEAAQEIDENDPSLTSESLADDTTKDAYAIPPPAPDGFWRAKLKLGKIKNALGQDADYKTWKHPNVENGKAMYVAVVDSFLIDLSGPYDGSRVSDSFVKSVIDSKKHTSQMTTIIEKAGGKALPKSTDRERLELLMKTLAGEPEVIVETVWEASCQTCRKASEAKGEKGPRPYLFGMHRFQQKLGKYDPSAQCPVCKTYNRAQVRVQQYFKVGEAKVTRGLGA